MAGQEVQKQGIMLAATRGAFSLARPQMARPAMSMASRSMVAVARPWESASFLGGAWARRHQAEAHFSGCWPVLHSSLLCWSLQAHWHPAQ